MRYPEIDPVAFSLGPLQVHWYGLAYLASFVLVWSLLRRRSQQPWSPLTRDQIEDLIFYGALGVVIGGRLGYVFLYKFGQFVEDPLWLFRVWEGGMSFHGGLLGVLIAVAIYAARFELNFLRLTDMVAPAVPIGLFLGRIANFVGQELWGRPTSAWYGMVFPRDPLGLSRHPSQLYEAFLEGIVLFAVLFWFSRQRRPTGAISGLFLLLYGLSRFVVEFVREPDAHIHKLIFGWMTRGQLFCLPMILVGLGLFLYAYKSQFQKRV
jgi:phosphatidylglycerol---prolipoprotein diacylglyceryl transferase